MGWIRPSLPRIFQPRPNPFSDSMRSILISAHSYPTTLAALLGLVLLPTAGPAQTLTGQVIDSISGAPVGTGFAVLMDGSDRELVRVLTDVDGSFTITAPRGAAGPFRIRSERIGYRVASSEPIVRQGDGWPAVTVRVNALPVALSEIAVNDETECRARPGDDERTAVVWGEIQKALAAASWTASRRSYRFISNIRERRLEGRRRRTLTEETHRRVFGRQTVPFKSREPSGLLREGYVIDEGTEHYAPDAEVLQSDEFMSTHCFRIVREPERRPDQVGLGFEPVPSRRLADVAGVLWLDERSAELRTLEYVYTNHPLDVRHDSVGGTLEFLPISSGAWIVYRWEIRMPLVAVTETRTPGRDRRRESEITGFYHTGGEVLSITGSDGTRVYQAPMARLTGEVLDARPVERPLAGAEVRISGTWFDDVTSRDGRFDIEAPLNGEYDVFFRHPALDSLGLTPPPQTVTLTRGRVTSVALRVPAMRDVVRHHCNDDINATRDRVLIGIVRDSATGRPVEGAEVFGTWQSIMGRGEGIRARNREARTTTGSDGRYRICGIEVGRPAVVYAVTESGRSRSVRVMFESDGVLVDHDYYYSTAPIWQRDITLSDEAAVSTLIAGVVQDRGTLEPLDGVVVTVDGEDSTATTDSSGLFRITGLQPGRYVVHLQRDGYEPRTGEITVRLGRPAEIPAGLLLLIPIRRAEVPPANGGRSGS